MFSTKYNTIIKYCLYALFILPLIFTPFTVFPWYFGKTIIFQIIIEILLFLFLLIFKKNRTGSENNCSFRLNYLDWSIIIFVAILLLTSFFGLDFNNSFFSNQNRANGVFLWIHFLLFYFFLFIFKEEKEWKRIFTINAVISSIAAITMIFPGILPDSWISGSGGGIIGNRAFAGYYMVVSLFLASCAFIKEKSQLRWLYLAPVAMHCVALYLLSNRGSIVGLAAGLFVAALCCCFFASKKIRNISIACLVAAAIILSCFFIWRENLKEFLPRVYGFTNYSYTSGTGATRLMAWKIALTAIKQQPWLGYGIGNFGPIFDRAYNPEFLKYGSSETVWDKPHNWLLEIGASGGIPALISYLSILFFAVYYLYKLRRRGGGAIYESAILIGALVAYAVTSLFLFETTNTLILWFFLLAYISHCHSRRQTVIPAQAGIQSSCHSRPQTVILSEAKNPPDSRLRGNDSWIFKILFILAIPILFVTLYKYNFLSIRSSYYLRRAELSVTPAEWSKNATQSLNFPVYFLAENSVDLVAKLDKFDKAGLLDSSNAAVKDAAMRIAGQFEEELNVKKDNYTYLIWNGQLQMILGEYFEPAYLTLAEKSLLKAAELAPFKQDPLFFLGRLYLLKKDFPSAIIYLNKSVELEPTVGLSHWLLGLSLVANGETKKGILEIEKAIELDYGLDNGRKDYLFELYEEEKMYDRAIAGYERLIDEEPENTNWYGKLMRVYAKAGKKKEVLDLANQIKIMSPQSAEEVDKFLKEYKIY